MSVKEHLHDVYVHRRRVIALRDHLAGLLPPDSSVLDIGSGDGFLAYLIKKRRTDIEIIGTDVLIRKKTHIPVNEFDGQVLPYDDELFDAVTLVDVLHHTQDPIILLNEAARVSRKYIVIKDHTLNGIFAHATLKFMDRVGNAHHGVALPHNYWTRDQWHSAFNRLKLKVDVWKKNLGLYGRPVDWIFGRSLHFITRLSKL